MAASDLDLQGTVITEEDAAAAREAMEADPNNPTPPSSSESDENPPNPSEDDQPSDETPKPDEADGDKPDPDTLEIPDPEEDSPDEADEADGELIDISAYAAEFDSSEGPSEETVQQLTEALGSKFANADELVQRFVAGQHALAREGARSAFEIVGGAETYSAMQEWAAANLPNEQRVAFNEAVANPQMAEMAIRGLHAQFTAASGQSSGGPTPSPRVQAGVVTSGGLEPLISIQQISEATADPRFDTDPAYRAEVQKRVALGNKRQA